MYRGPSPIFDVPEFPPLRRVKPLPKRRRTSAMDVSLGGNPSMMDVNTAGMSMGMNMNMNMAMTMGMGFNMGMGVGVGTMSDLLEYQRGMATTTTTTAGTALNHNASSASITTSTSQDHSMAPVTTMTTTATPSGTISTSSSPHSPSPTQSTPTSFPSYYIPMSVPLSMSMFNNVGMGMQDLFRMGLGSIGSIMAGGGVAGTGGNNTSSPTSISNNNSSNDNNNNNNNSTTSDWSNSITTPTGPSQPQIPFSLPFSLHHPLSTSEYPGGFAIPVGPTDEDDHGDGDYVDHLQHPGNTKKRKVPAANGYGNSGNHSGSHGTFGGSSAMSMSGGSVNQTYMYPYGYTHQLGEVGDEDPGENRDPATSQRALAYNESGQGQVATSTTPTSHSSIPVGGGQVPTPAPYPPFIIHKNKTSAATLAGLQHKDLLKTRKRQLATVLGALSHGDPLALDQALSARYIGLGLGNGDKKGGSRGGVISGAGKENFPLSHGGNGYGYVFASERERRRRRRKTRESVASSTDPNSISSPSADAATPSIRGPPLGVVDANADSGNRTDETTTADQIADARDATREQRTLLPCADFTFACPSLTSERLISTRKEVAILHARFESELSKQAAKAAEAAAARQQAQAQAKLQSQQQQQGGNAQGRGSKRGVGKKNDSAIGNGAKNHPGAGGKTNTTIVNSHGTKNVNVAAVDGSKDSHTPTTSSTTATVNNIPSKSRAKKKKRSALANASNPHHLRNYVPSRLPYSSGGANNYGGGGAGVSGGYGHGYNGYGLGPPVLGLLSPLPVTFLTAEIAPRDSKPNRRKSKNAGANGNAMESNNGRASPRTVSAQAGGNNSAHHSPIPLILPEDEWICPLCEYYLFYGDDAAFRRAIKWRKKILNRRRRARERAAAAASGTRLPSTATTNNHANANSGGRGVGVNNADHAALNEDGDGDGDEYDSIGGDAEGEEYFEDREHVIDQEYHEHFRDRERDGGGIDHHGLGHYGHNA